MTWFAGNRLVKVLLCGIVAVELLAATQAHTGAPSEEELANASYRGVYDEPVTLENGSWEGEPFAPGAASRPSVDLVRDFRLSGDLNGDGRDEAVVLLAESSGGTGTNLFLAAVARRDGSVVSVATALIGDRVQVMEARVKNGDVELEVVQAGPLDGVCCPSQKTTRRWSLDGTTLKEGAPAVTGKLSLQDIEGPEWVLTHRDWEDPAPAEPKVTLKLEGNRVVGAGGCNSYFADVRAGGTPGELSVGPIAVTPIACPGKRGELEGRYLKALEGAFQYSFLAGKLALTTKTGEVYSTLLFGRAQ